MRHFFAVLLIALATACVPEARNATVSESQALVPAADKAPRQDIIGQYVVKLINGTSPVINIEGHEPTITISAQRIHFQSQCIYADWTYQRDGEAFSAERYYEPGSAMCARALEAGEAAIQDAIDKASTVRRTVEGIQLERGGYRLELHRRG